MQLTELLTEPQLINYLNFRKSLLLRGNYFHFVEVRDWRHNKIKYLLLRAKKVGHQTSVSFEKFNVVQALLSFCL
jgi:hypothetical protein